jgi:hypothetical protein
MSVSMASGGRKMGFISARVSGKDEGTGVEDGDWERADEGFVFKTIDASCSRRLVGIVAEVGGGRWRKTLDDVFIFLPNFGRCNCLTLNTPGPIHSVFPGTHRHNQTLS